MSVGKKYYESTNETKTLLQCTLNFKTLQNITRICQSYPAS